MQECESGENRQGNFRQIDLEIDLDLNRHGSDLQVHGAADQKGLRLSWPKTNKPSFQAYRPNTDVVLPTM